MLFPFPSNDRGYLEKAHMHPTNPNQSNSPALQSNIVSSNGEGKLRICSNFATRDMTKMRQTLLSTKEPSIQDELETSCLPLAHHFPLENPDRKHSYISHTQRYNAELGR
ncbi:hypothetical protein V6N11_050509 [Hibiscus sabdariffa]|uniref:Uncharacterized protein n=1 Tax=Hibiscus sabdariffa TaxID=183260 RepID=A0ABR2TAV2_9ROSI